jgi:hypothetical protein
MPDDPMMDRSEIQTAFDEIFDQALVFHGFADYLRDYELYVHVTADPRTGIHPKHLRYRFKHCVRASATTALSPQIWRDSLDERLIDYDHGVGLDGYVWGVKFQVLYPGLSLVEDSADARQWSADLGLPFHEATIETNGHNVTLVFADLAVDVVEPGHVPFAVPDGGPGFKFPLH